jgi:hypothetical protein
MYRILITLLIFLSLAPVAAQQNAPWGIIQGRVFDRENRAPLPGANLILLNSTLGAVTTAEGEFAITRVPVGAYTLECRFIGYEKQILTDIIVRPQRITQLEVMLKAGTVAGGAVTVKAGYFPEQDDHPLSLTSFSFEEIRRAPGAAGDISRIIQGLPSLAKVNDQNNPLIVRGGSPMENAFFIDQIEVPNINHFPSQGASSGPIGMIQVDFIQDARFHAGGFSAAYGDRLSSILDISFREGSREKVEGQLDLNYAGFGGAVEGPLPAGRGSWMAAARRSYLDLVMEKFEVGSTVAPRYGDYQGKLVWDLTPNHRLSLLALWGDDHNNPDRDAAVANKMLYYGRQDLLQGTTGLSWRALWGRSGYSQTALSWSTADYAEDFRDTNSGEPLLHNRSGENTTTLRNVNHLRLSERHSIEFGFELRTLNNHYDNRYGAAQAGPISVKAGITGMKTGLFVEHITRPLAGMTLTLGLRADHFSRTGGTSLSPRANLSWAVDPLTRFSASAGLFQQSLPALILAHQAGSRLPEMRARHLIIGMERLLTADTRFSVEAYQKSYSRFPIAGAEPGLFIVDELVYGNAFYQHHGELGSTGVASSHGVEMMVQKKMARNLYGLASATWFRSRYRGGDGIWRNRTFDNRIIFAMEGGYKPSHGWEVSLRWIYAGGAPFTPVDAAASMAAHNTILHSDRINSERYPAYHSLNIRADRRFTFAHSNLVAYLSIWNVYNRRNVAGYFWNEAAQKVDTIYQFGMLPILGLEYEF